MLSITSLLVGFASIYFLYVFLGPKKASAPLPPGPPPKPIIGNIKDLPPPGSKDWQHWLDHKEKYGPISSITVFGQTLVVLNDPDMALEMLEKRSAKHSSRPHLPIAELSGWDKTLGLLPYNNRFRAYRKATYRELGSANAAGKFDGIVDKEVTRFLLRVIKSPNNLVDHLRKESGAIILRIGYGYTIEPHARDPLVDLVDKAMDDFSQVVLPGAWLVNFVPFLKYLPTWFPGGKENETAKEYKDRLAIMHDKTYDFVKNQMAKGTHQASYVSSLLEKDTVLPGSEEEIVVKYSAGALYGGGADTTVSALSCFFMAMALNPTVQKKAQEEIDRVVGTSRLPELSDQNNLPYVNAVFQEVFRWHPVTPLSVTHASSEEDIFNGYLIPKGAIIVPNVWAFTHDPANYHNPEAFNPDRFLGATPQPDPRLYAFGFGRRICPGRLLAEKSIFLTVARALAVLDIRKKVQDGKEVPIRVEFSSGTISHPVPFEVDLKPRSKGHEELVRAVEREFPWEASHAKELGI
ncbi:flavonoid 3-hydroxylase [Aspergillus eucalypticola CBS 122712]|uniref:Flavonoid 3-hydroxylase n=1 Tax=Aspergillus eucalypticola (strain CBS 122712 / IBT 29274) TaxID=1448314 RepID=A0A317WBD9_ASPEC|nr:flavonoid 3-hydroxylase [Aspergillus eucalypticola CBS 122712]PWY82348.1 flavonoid 3-hydroxylase [Aspergillus eucalypticola CBS 122712]